MTKLSISEATSSSSYFSAARFQDDEKLLTIDWVDIEEFKKDGTTKKKLVLGFRDQEKKLVLNVTNGEILSEAFGDDADNLLGKRIILYRGKTRFGGESVASLMIRIPADIPDSDDAPF